MQIEQKAVASPLLQLETLIVEQIEAGGICYGRVWLTRPVARNALSSTALQDIVQAFSFLQNTQHQLQVVILAGKGKSFSAGADLKEAGAGSTSASSGRARRHAAQLGRRAICAIESLEAITIACVQGHAAGGGFGLMLACDLRLCTHDARLWLPEVDINMPLTWGLTARLIRDIGRPKAMELIAFCDDLLPETALRLGLINQVATSELELEQIAIQWAERLANKNPTTLHLVKTQFKSLDHTIDLGNSTMFDNDWLLYNKMLDAKL